MQETAMDHREEVTKVKGQVPETLSNVTPLPAPEPGEPGNRWPRARSNIRGKRANTLPAVIPGEKIFKVDPDPQQLREWARKRHFDVKDKGPIPKAVREAFEKENGAWTVKIITVIDPRTRQPRQFYQARQGLYLIREDYRIYLLKRTLGAELFAMLKLVKR